MNRLVRLGITGTLVIILGSPAAARSHRSDPPELPPPPVLQVPDLSAVPPSEPPPLGEVIPLPPPPPPPAPVTRTRKYWELSMIGGATLGGIYLLSILTGAMSYAGYYQGQWGWYVPVVGPMLTMGGGGGQICSCASNQIYTYGIGSILTLATVGAIVPIVLGGVLKKTVPMGPSRVQLAPTIASDSGGLVMLGRF